MLTFWAAPPPARLYGPSKEQAGAGSRLFRSQTSGGWSDSHPPGFSHLKTAFRPPRCKSTRGPTRLPPVRTRPRPRRPRAGTRLIPVSPAGGRTAPTRSLGHAWCPVCSLLCDVSGFVLGDFSAKIFEISCTTWGCGGGGVQGAQCPSAQMLASRRPSRQRTAGSPASPPARTGVASLQDRGELRSRPVVSCWGSVGFRTLGSPVPVTQTTLRENTPSPSWLLSFTLCSLRRAWGHTGVVSRTNACTRVFTRLALGSWRSPQSPPAGQWEGPAGSSSGLCSPGTADWSSRSRTSGSGVCTWGFILSHRFPACDRPAPHGFN